MTARSQATNTQKRPKVQCSATTKQLLFNQVTPDRAFLPAQDPLLRLPPGLQAYEDALQELPKLTLGSPGFLRQTLQDLPCFDLQQLPALASCDTAQLLQQLPPACQCYTAAAGTSSSSSSSPQQSTADVLRSFPSCDAQLWRAYMVLAFLTHGFLWCDGPGVPSVLTQLLAQPFAAVSAAIGMPPVLTYATYNLMNWRRLDPAAPLELGNICCQHNFFGGMDEEWFRLIHVAIEAAAAPAIAALQPLQQAALQHDAAAMELHFAAITSALQAMQELLARMGERCDPYVYYKRVRVPMSGWRNNEALPQGLVYEGLWGNQPQQLYGETGAQSTVVHALDAALGIQHTKGWMQAYLTDMRAHMPPSHRAFLHQLEQEPSVRDAVQALAQTTTSSSSSNNNSSGSNKSSSSSSLVEAYDAAIAELERFRSQHRAFAIAYIAQWSKKEAKEVGTGGSDFVPALSAYKDATAAHKLAGSSSSSRGCPLHS
uniref:Indoleamine 2,3-dioxygenase n=1 Tax=Tetradesmus obliquus TaxID=3088 RepID=A0A383VPZ4_TETOB|eukprot:jgi/Sobl393_1/5646/SZX67251.1